MANIRELRKAARMTQEELATALGLNRRTVIAWEKGEQCPRLYIPQTQELCRLLNCELKDVDGVQKR